MNRKYKKRGTFGGVMHIRNPEEKEPVGTPKCRWRK